MEKDKKINKLCEKCLRKCKQPDHIILLGCPKFEPRSVQLTLNFKPKRKKKK